MNKLILALATLFLSVPAASMATTCDHKVTVENNGKADIFIRHVKWKDKGSSWTSGSVVNDIVATAQSYANSATAADTSSADAKKKATQHGKIKPGWSTTYTLPTSSKCKKTTRVVVTYACQRKGGKRHEIRQGFRGKRVTLDASKCN